MMNSPHNDRRGFTLIELLIAVVIMSTVGIGLTQTLVVAARQATKSGDIAYRAAAMSSEISRITAIPEGALPDTTYSRTVPTIQFPHQTVVTASTSGMLQTVTITITPTGQRAISGLTRTIVRRAGSNPSPFN